jgi:hypothetical protein
MLWERIRKVQERVFGVPPFALAIGYLFGACVMLLLTQGAGLLTISTDGGKRFKGFWWESNWGFNHLLVIPLTLLLCSYTLRYIDRMVRSIAEGEMAVDGTWQPIPELTLEADWSQFRLRPVWMVVIAFFAFAYSWSEWFLGSAVPIWAGTSADAAPAATRTIGWTSGALLDPNINRTANSLLSFVAFTAQGLVVTFICYTYAMTLAFCSWISRYDSDSPNTRFVPDLRSTDRRRGFERFEGLILCLLFSALAFTIVLFCIRIQSVYDYSESKAQTAFHFILDDAVGGFFQGVEKLVTNADPALFDTGSAFNSATPFVFAAMLLTMVIAAIVPTFLLFYLASRSQRTLGDCLASPPCPPCGRFVATGHTEKECQERKDAMDFWPLRYPRALELVAYIVFAGFCFVFYKFTFVLLGILGTRLVATVIWALYKSIRDNAASGPDGQPKPPERKEQSPDEPTSGEGAPGSVE